MKRQEYKISFEPTGRLRTPDEVPSATATALRKRLIEQDAHVDLSLSPDFQTAFSSAMLFPEEDPGNGCED